MKPTKYSLHYESWPCDACLRDHPAHVSPGGYRVRAYCPDLGLYVYSPEALREHWCP